ncbi:MAG: glycoside hydrolase family 10 protein [Deinococcales bacterium]
MRIIFVFLTALLCIALAQPTQIGQPSAPQLRGLWVDAFGAGFKTQKEVDELIAFASRMKLNALFVQVGRRMDCFCNRSSVPRSMDPKLAKNFDPLAAIIQKAKPLGIQVHAWIITTAAFNTAEPYFSSDHVMARYGRTSPNTWLTLNTAGASRAGRDEILDVGHPEAADYIVQFYISVLENYDIDGIQFDRVRYPDSGDSQYRPVWGYNPTSLARFRKETGRTDTPIPTDPQWAQWRREQMTNLVRRIYLEAKLRKPKLWVSAATITYRAAPRNIEEFQRTRTYTEVLQDWVGWTAAGILDLNIPMNYKREYDPIQKLEFDGWNAFAAVTRERAQVATGAGIFVNSLADSSKQYSRALATAGIAGWVGYSYRTADLDVLNTQKNEQKGKQDFATVFSKLFSSRPSWGVPNQNNLSGILGRVVQDGLGVVAELELLAADGSSMLVQSDANGYFGVPRLPVGKVRVGLLGRSQNSVGVVSSLDIAVRQGTVQRIPDFVLP